MNINDSFEQFVQCMQYESARDNSSNIEQYTDFIASRRFTAGNTLFPLLLSPAIPLLFV